MLSQFLLFIFIAQIAAFANEERAYNCRKFKLALSKQEGKDTQFNASTDAQVSHRRDAL